MNPPHPRMLCNKIGWNWLSGSGEENFLISSMYFHYFVIMSSWKRAGPFIWTNLNPLHPRMLCAKFGWNWPSGSGEENFFYFVNVFSQMEGQRLFQRWGTCNNENELFTIVKIFLPVSSNLTQRIFWWR